MKTIFYFWFIFSAVAILVPLKSYGQSVPPEKTFIKQNFIWYRYQNRLIFSDKWELVSHIDDRRFLNKEHLQHTWVFRTQPFYHINEKLSVSQGYVLFLQSPHDPESESRLMVPEHRPFQEMLIKNDIGKISIRHRYRLEERFFRKNDGTQLLDGYNFNWRFRYQLQAQKKLFDIDDHTAVHFRIAQELMLNFGKRIIYNSFDQNRLSAAFYINLSKYFDLEAGYTHWFQQRADGKSYFNRHILRITLSHNIDLRKN